MKMNLANPTWLRPAGIFLAGATLTGTMFGVGVPIALTQPKPTEVAVKSSPTAADLITDAISTLQHSKKRWIEVNLSTQRLIAWEGKKPIHAVIVSTGKASTPTRSGVYSIESKLRSARMQGDDYDVPDVPFTMYYSGGYAIHGAYWHNRFGTPVSHGCVNVAVDHAEWLFRWASVGTPIVVHR